MLRIRDYPKDFQIGDSIWNLRFVRRVPGESVDILGLTDPSETTIYIKLGQSPKERFKTVIHELFHALEHEFKVEIPHGLIYKLENPLFRLIFDNLFGGTWS